MWWAGPTLFTTTAGIRWTSLLGFFFHFLSLFFFFLLFTLRYRLHIWSWNRRSSKASFRKSYLLLPLPHSRKKPKLLLKALSHLFWNQAATIWVVTFKRSKNKTHSPPPRWPGSASQANPQGSIKKFPPPKTDPESSWHVSLLNPKTTRRVFGMVLLYYTQERPKEFLAWFDVRWTTHRVPQQNLAFSYSEIWRYYSLRKPKIYIRRVCTPEKLYF